MKKAYHFPLLLVIFFSCLFLSKVSAQVPLRENPAAIEAIKVTLDHIYNFEFETALKRLENGHGLGNHPANSLINAVLIYWRDSPLVPGSEIYQTYEKYLNQAIELSEPFLEQERLYSEGAFYSLAGYGFLAELYADEGASLKALSMARQAYKYLKIGKEKMDEIPDFYFSTGLYNYYRVKYPELHPFYKSFLWLFEGGDKALGIEQLKICTSRAVFTRNEALIYLFHIYLRYENNPGLAYPYARELVNKFPRNIKFSGHLAEVLVAMNEFDRAEGLCDTLLKSDRTVYQFCGNVLKGIIYEKTGRLQEAEKTLSHALQLHDSLRKQESNYLSMIYAAQARIEDRRHHTDLAATLYKKALKADPYVPVKLEAETYLDK